MKRKSESRQERKMIIGAVAMLIIATLLFGLATEPGMNLMQNIKNAVMPKTSITISAANNETLKNKITEAKLVAGYNHFIALTADGKVYGWGYNGKGQLGINKTTSNKEQKYIRYRQRNRCSSRRKLYNCSKTRWNIMGNRKQ